MKKLFMFAAVGFLFATGAANADEKSGVGVNTAQSCEDIVNARLKKDASAAGSTEEVEVDANGKPVKAAN